MLGGDKGELIETLAALGPRLARVLVSASVDQNGALGGVGGLSEKIEALLAADALEAIQAVALASAQRDAHGKPLEENPAFAHRLVGTETYDPRCRSRRLAGADRTEAQ